MFTIFRADGGTQGVGKVASCGVSAGFQAGAAVEAGGRELRQRAEAQLAAHTGDYTPTQLRGWGAHRLHLLDQDGPEPDHRDPGEGNELLLGRDRTGNGGWLKPDSPTRPCTR